MKAQAAFFSVLFVGMSLAIGLTGISPAPDSTLISLAPLPGSKVASLAQSPSPDHSRFPQNVDATTRVSIASDGTQANSDSCFLSVSADGRYVAFYSLATNLVVGDTNDVPDIFVHDRQTGETTRVSVASDGTQASGSSFLPSISADGRTVAFESGATNLVPGDTNGVTDVFVHDRQTGETARVSVGSDGTQANQVSYDPSVSADGRYVAFYSEASNLVPGDTNNEWDVFRHDRETGQTTRVSVA
jgi:Tol biopolymer transport system component